MVFPDYFADRAKRWLQLAMRIGDPKLAQTFADRAKILTHTAVEGERWLGRISGADKPSPPVVVSRANTLGELRLELRNLLDKSSLCVRLKDCSPGQRQEFWRASPQLTEEFRCTAEFRPDGSLWFVKHD
jgi:hypothetical protein